MAKPDAQLWSGCPIAFEIPKECDMFTRSQTVTLAAAMLAAGLAVAQTQTPPGQTSPTPPDARTGSPTANPRDTTTGNPGAVPQDQMDPYSTDKEFVKNVLESNATEVHLGKLAQDKASSDAVKELGKRMVEAHTQTSEQLKQAATALNVPVPAEPTRKAKKAEDKLAKLSGADFDRAYAKMAAEEQKQAVKQFERESKNGKVPGVKEFASKNLSVEQERQKQAEELASAGTGTASRQK
jgi:putative membrane protein